jgi:hypothetical protein
MQTRLAESTPRTVTEIVVEYDLDAIVAFRTQPTVSNCNQHI